MFTSSRASVSNIFAATPGFDRIPAPTSETRPIPGSLLTPLASVSFTTFSITDIARVSSSFGTVNEMSVWPAEDTFCTIMSTLTSSSARARNTEAAIPGRSGTCSIVTLASDVSCVTPEMIACSIVGSSSRTQVPGSQLKLERTWTGTP